MTKVCKKYRFGNVYSKQPFGIAYIPTWFLIVSILRSVFGSLYHSHRIVLVELPTALALD